jgi:hypothetical protein
MHYSLLQFALYALPTELYVRKPRAQYVIIAVWLVSCLIVSAGAATAAALVAREWNLQQTQQCSNDRWVQSRSLLPIIKLYSLCIALYSFFPYQVGSITLASVDH